MWLSPGFVVWVFLNATSRIWRLQVQTIWETIQFTQGRAHISTEVWHLAGFAVSITSGYLYCGKFGTCTWDDYPQRTSHSSKTYPHKQWSEFHRKEENVIPCSTRCTKFTGKAIFRHGFFIFEGSVSCWEVDRQNRLQGIYKCHAVDTNFTTP